MLFVGLLTAKSGTLREHTAHRMQFKYPPGVKLIGEYWLLSSKPGVVSILEADDAASIMQVTSEWGDEFDIQVSPAVTVEQGLELAKQMMEE